MNNTIYIDLTSVYNAGFLSGIQRTVIELTKRVIITYKKCVLLIFSREKNVFFVLPNSAFTDFFAKKGNIKVNNLNKFDVKKLCKNDIWLDIDSVWDVVCLKRHILYPFLAKRKVKILSLIYDLLPLLYPKYFDGNINKLLFLYITSIFYYSDVILVNSKYVKNQVVKILNDLNVRKRVEVIELGSDFTYKNHCKMKIGRKVKKLKKDVFLLMVGTIEPRKNHLFLIEAYNNYLSKKFKNLKLVFAGRIGWSNKKILKKIKENKNCILINEPNDKEIEFLYKNAYALIFPSVSEGYGLPIVESLHYKCPVFATNIDLFDEISKKNAILFDINNPAEFANKISFYLANKKSYARLKKNISSFEPISWDDSCLTLKKIIDEFL